MPCSLLFWLVLVSKFPKWFPCLRNLLSARFPHWPLLYRTQSVTKLENKWVSIYKTVLNHPRKEVSIPGQFMLTLGYAVVQLVKALRYKLKRLRFDSWWGHLNFNSFNPSGRTSKPGFDAACNISSIDNSWGVDAAVLGPYNNTTFIC